MSSSAVSYPEAPLSKIYERRKMTIPAGTGLDMIWGPCSLDELIEQCKEDALRTIETGDFGHDQLLPPGQLPTAPKRASADGQVVHETIKRYHQRLRRHRQRGYKDQKRMSPAPPTDFTAAAQELEDKRCQMKSRVNDAVEEAKKKKEEAKKKKEEAKKKKEEAEAAAAVAAEEGESWEEGLEVEVGVAKVTIVKRAVVNEMLITEKVGEKGWNFNRMWEEVTSTVTFGEEGMKVVSTKRTGREDI